MATLLTFPRTLPSILLDLSTTRQRLACHYARFSEPTDEEDRDWSDLEDRRAALETEWKERFYRETGCDWSIAEAALA